jgi:hypothetical protein
MYLRRRFVMRQTIQLVVFAAALCSSAAFADSTTYKPRATGFTLPNAQQAVTASSADTATYATTAGSTAYATNAGTATSATNATFATSTATNATFATSAESADTASVAQQAAGLTPGNNCPAGYALSVTKGVLGCVNSVTSITGQLDGSQIIGNITNVGAIRTSGNIVSGTNIVSTGYVIGNNGLYSGNGVYSTDYFGRGGGSNANFNGTADSAGTATTAGYATSAGSANYANSSVVGILHQSQPGDGSTFSCDTGYHVVFYDLNVGSTNNSFFYECIQNGH